MLDFLDYMSIYYTGFRHTYDRSKNACDIVYDYIRRLLCCAIGENKFDSERELFDIVLAM